MGEAQTPSIATPSDAQVQLGANQSESIASNLAKVQDMVAGADAKAPEIVPEETQPLQQEQLDDSDLFPSKKKEKEQDVPDWKKGIEKLREENKLAREENKLLKEQLKLIEQKFSNPQQEKKKYSSDDLKGAIQKGIEDNNPNLLYEVFNHMAAEKQEALREEYLKTQERQTQMQNMVMQEWQNVVDTYSELSTQKFYEGSEKELDIKSQDSLLYKLAGDYYKSNPERYNIPGGQMRAVSDALTAILKKKISTAGTEKAATLQKQLAKEKIKNSLDIGSSLPQESSIRAPKSQLEELDEYINERKKFQNSKM